MVINFQEFTNFKITLFLFSKNLDISTIYSDDAPHSSPTWSLKNIYFYRVQKPSAKYFRWMIIWYLVISNLDSAFDPIIISDTNKVQQWFRD